jgi:hypothetical protein
MLVLSILPQQTFNGMVIPSVKWAGVVGAYLTFRLFSIKNYWVIFYNLRLQGITILIIVTIVYEVAVFIFGLWFLKV